MRAPTLQHHLEYAGIRAVVFALRFLPFRAGSAVGAALGRLAYRLGIRARVTETQIAFAFPTLTHAQVTALARESYENLGRTSIEAALMEGATPADLLALFDRVDGWEHLDAILQAGRGGLLVTGHLGNWELGGSYIAARGVPIDAIARHMGNRVFERYLTRVRQRFGVQVVFDEQAVRQTPRSVRHNRIVGFLSDQGVLGLASLFVPFFGRVAKTPRGPAVFALRLGVPMVFVAAVRQASGHYRLVVEPLEVQDSGDREADVLRLVTAYTERLEHWVREYPGQYFWQHRRWKYQPDGAPPLPEGM
ncbi:MAG: lysophospholipid acyltransferase family protein [Gemmatimonadaceae bacterium]|nr:lysophospholipid acyltransferase family protein [Gemmatimonadaceae bacterium]